MKLFGTPRRRWYLLATLWAIVLVLGVGGFLQQAADNDIGRSALDTLYLTLQLAALDYGGDSGVNWRLEVARFAAPMMAAGTILQTASVVFREQFARFRLRFLRGHTVVCGLGDSGSRLAVALAGGGGRTVIGVERDQGATGIGRARDRDLPVVIGDASDPDVLATARVDRAARVVVLCGTDATNVAVAATIASLPRRTRRTALRCSVHLSDAELCALLRGGELRDSGEVHTDFFNLHERAARMLLSEHELLGTSDRLPHLAVLGLGQLGRSVAVAAAQRHAETSGVPLRITLVDRSASGRWQALRLQHPAMDAACATAALDLDLEAPEVEAADAFSALLRDDPPTGVAVLFEDESLALSTALLVHRTIDDPTIPVVVRTRADSGLGMLVAPQSGAAPPFPGLALFPFLNHACTPEVVDGGVREQLGRAIHEDYLARAGTGDGLRRAWDTLSDDERESSRRAADGILDGLDAVGCELDPLRRWGAPGLSFTADEVEKLAQLEHERWLDERAEAGWTYGAERDDEELTNPLLVPWNELPEAARQSNRVAAQGLPAMLARAGFEPQRL